ncbi:hypothetical protein [Lysobacter sp.]|uniref:hypothetical protein n=1 Tax=Lysobacter sp. TaxID=72226 RepID=UPI002D635A6A|nr:hypothetical protein [Lysobacter sp.]HZX79246.1 hypothetical protein [Lysobacter sp.]
MSRRNLGVLALVFASAVLALVGGGSFLEWSLPGGLPLGNAIAAAGLCALAGMAVVIALPGSPARLVAWLALLACVAWLPASVALAGNLSLNFTWSRGITWMWLTLGTLGVSVVALAWAVIARFIASRRKTAEA